MNHTDKERFAAASQPRRVNDGVLVPVLYQPPRSRSRRVSDLKVPNSVVRPKCEQYTSLNKMLSIFFKSVDGTYIFYCCIKQ